MVPNHCLLHELETYFTCTSECCKEKIWSSNIGPKNDERYYQHSCIQNPFKNTVVNENADQEVNENRHNDFSDKKSAPKRKLWNDININE